MTKDFDLITFLDLSQIYLDILSSCALAVSHLAYNIEDSADLQAISTALNHAISELKKLHESCSDNKKEVIIHE